MKSSSVFTKSVRLRDSKKQGGISRTRADRLCAEKMNHEVTKTQRIRCEYPSLLRAFVSSWWFSGIGVCSMSFAQQFLDECSQIVARLDRDAIERAVELLAETRSR